MQGGSEAKHSNELLHRIISEAVEAVAPEVGPGLIGLVNTRDEIRDLLKLDDVIDLVSPNITFAQIVCRDSPVSTFMTSRKWPYWCSIASSFASSIDWPRAFSCTALI